MACADAGGMMKAIISLWNDTVDPPDPRTRALRLEQLKLAVRNSDQVMSSIVPMTAIIAAGLSLWAPWMLMASWFCAVVAASYVMRRFMRPYVSGELHEKDLRRHSVRFFFADMAFMSLHGAVAPLAWPADDPMSQAIIMLVMGATMSTVVPITGPSRIAFAADIIPIALLAVITPVAFNGVEGLPIAALAAAFAYMMVDGARGSYGLAENALTLNDENQALITRLRASDRAKSDFLANMSHELRTPLNAILGFSEVMKDEVMGPMENRIYKGYAADIHGSGQHLLGLINDILDLARIESGRIELQDDVFSLDAIADVSFGLIRMQADAKGVSLIKDVPVDMMVRWDLRTAKQIAINLMSNAVKFTPTGGSITIRAGGRPDGSAFIAVIDTGCGIEPEYHEKIFEHFAQGRHDVAIEAKSTGLGLAIVKGLVELHGGSLELTSAVGHGTSIAVVIPPERLMTNSASVGRAEAA
jgi:two-component system cell cycle sensor histidine kinase PleC